MSRMDLTGRNFGRWTVLSYAETRGKIAYWNCKCDCGVERIVSGGNLKSGKSTSCGCYRSELHITKLTTHGQTGTHLHNLWKNMKARCYQPSSARYYRYGGRGITVCDEWRNDFSAFREWAMANGYQEGLSIERIDIDGDYCPENCIWVTKTEQMANTSRSVYITYRGERKHYSAWAKELGIPVSTIQWRLQHGHNSPEEALKR